MTAEWGAIKMDWEDDTTGYVVLRIHEYRSRGPVFEVNDSDSNGTHLLSAADVRGSWSAWVGALVPDAAVVTQVSPGIEVY